MTIKTVTGILAAAVATGGTFTVGYPTGDDRGSFSLGVYHKLSVLGKVFTAPENMTLSFGATSVTVTYNGTTTLPAGSRFTFQFDEIGSTASPTVESVSGAVIYTHSRLALLNLGSPGAPSANAYCLSQSVAIAPAVALLNGALCVSSIGYADARTGRNVVAAWTTTAVITVTGKDMYGRTMVEQSASGTSFTGKKAFKTITSVTFSAAVTGATVGTASVLGLPVYVPNTSMVLKESADGAAATAGTLVAGLTLATKPTATTADNRGTYAPNSAPNGSIAFNLLVALPDPEFLGATQFVS